MKYFWIGVVATVVILITVAAIVPGLVQDLNNSLSYRKALATALHGTGTWGTATFDSTAASKAVIIRGMSATAIVVAFQTGSADTVSAITFTRTNDSTATFTRYSKAVESNAPFTWVALRW